MKKILMIGIAALASVAFAQGLSLADASNEIGSAAESPAKMTALTKQLSAEDQVAFLARVNQAIGAMPGSATEKAAKYLDANEAALRGAAKGNVPALLAEVFATVPPEVLTAINERFATELFSRTANGANISDAAFVQAAKTAMAAVEKRMASVDNAAVRNTFAVLMFLRASNGTPADLADTLVAGVGDAQAQAIAKSEWIQPAMEGNYEPMLGASDAGEQPDFGQILRIRGPQMPIGLWADISVGEAVAMPYLSVEVPKGIQRFPGFDDDASSLNTVPRTTDKTKPWSGAVRRGSRPAEPHGYSMQGTGGSY